MYDTKSLVSKNHFFLYTRTVNYNCLNYSRRSKQFNTCSNPLAAAETHFKNRLGTADIPDYFIAVSTFPVVGVVKVFFALLISNNESD